MVFLLSMHELITAELETVQTGKFISAPPHLSAGPNPMQSTCLRQCPCCPPGNLPHHNNNYSHYKHEYPAGPRQEPPPHQQSWYEKDSRPVCHSNLIFSAWWYFTDVLHTQQIFSDFIGRNQKMFQRPCMAMCLSVWPLLEMWFTRSAWVAPTRLLQDQL